MVLGFDLYLRSLDFAALLDKAYDEIGVGLECCSVSLGAARNQCLRTFGTLFEYCLPLLIYDSYTLLLR